MYNISIGDSVKKKILIGVILTLVLFFGCLGIYINNLDDSNIIDNKIVTNRLEAVVVSVNDTNVLLMDINDVIYNFSLDMINGNVGDSIVIEYTGVLDYNSDIQNVEVIEYNLVDVDSEEFPSSYDDNGIFSDYYTMAYNKLKELSLDEKIGQMILARYPEDNIINDLKEYKLGGYVFFEKDFKNKTKLEVINMINNVQNNSDIPLLTAVDEEGGSVVRISSNPNLVSERFKSSRELYSMGGMDAIRNDTINKSKVLSELGINLNLAPVVDVTTDSSDYMYERSLGEDTETTSLYAKTVVEASKGLGVSYTLKHFPGYGNNVDTHDNSSVDSRSYESILANDIPPFQAGIDVGAEAVLVSHNIVTSIDGDNPASLSLRIHNLLRNDLNFTGVIITDDLYMGATSSITDAVVKAVLAGNNLIITTDYANSIYLIKSAVSDGTISEDMIDKLVFKVLAWKYYKGLMIDVK